MEGSGSVQIMTDPDPEGPKDQDPGSTVFHVKIFAKVTDCLLDLSIIFLQQKCTKVLPFLSQCPPILKRACLPKS